MQWKHRPVEEVILETKKEMWDKYPQLFVDTCPLPFPYLDYISPLIVQRCMVGRLEFFVTNLSIFTSDSYI